MKVFISWSGDLSKKVAECLKKWLPCYIQSLDVFFSPEDIEKGDQWDNKISTELENCDYGIICLTHENISAPWINFEAGAIAKSLDSKVATLMIGINPSDIKGPLSRYQATKNDKNDFYQLIKNINNNTENKVSDDVLKTTFENLWENMNKEVESIISASLKIKKPKKDSIDNNDAIEEMLTLLRKQNNILSSPENILPIGYYEYLNDRIGNSGKDQLQLFEELFDFFEYLYIRSINSEALLNEFKDIDITRIIKHIEFYCPKNTKFRKQFQGIRRAFEKRFLGEYELPLRINPEE